MIYHYTATFNNDTFKYHGEVEMPYIRKENIEKNKDYIITECKKQFIRDCERWGVDAKNVWSEDRIIATFKPERLCE